MKNTEFGSREGTFLRLHPRFLSNFLFFFHYFVSSWVLLDQIRRAAIRAMRSWTFIAHVLEMHLILSKTHSQIRVGAGTSARFLGPNLFTLLQSFSRGMMAPFQGSCSQV